MFKLTSVSTYKVNGTAHKSSKLVAMTTTARNGYRPPIQLASGPLHVTSGGTYPSPAGSLQHSFDVHSELGSISFASFAKLTQLAVTLERSGRGFEFSTPPGLGTTSTTFEWASREQVVRVSLSYKLSPILPKCLFECLKCPLRPSNGVSSSNFSNGQFGR